MSKADYPYPDDEFDRAADADPDIPRGVHRAPRSAWSRWWPFVVVVVLAPLLAFGAVTVWGLVNDSSMTGTDDSGATVPDDAATSDPGDGAQAPAEGAETGTPEPPAQTEPPTPTPVLTTPVTVLNGASIKNLAGTQADKLTAVGFTAVDTGNTTGARPGENTVFYKSEDLKDTATMVGQTLGITTVTMSAAQAGDGITVVLVSNPSA
ncbi:LytR C-terminal domain-containing protein [Cellulomonas sp. URHB0016]